MSSKERTEPQFWIICLFPNLISVILIDRSHKVSHLKVQYKTNTIHIITSSCLSASGVFIFSHLLLHVHSTIMPTTKCKLCQLVKNSVVVAISESSKTASCGVGLPLRSVVASGYKHLVQVLVHIWCVCADNYKPQIRSCWSAAAEKSSVLSWFKAKCKTRCEWPRSSIKYLYWTQRNISKQWCPFKENRNNQDT